MCSSRSDEAPLATMSLTPLDRATAHPRFASVRAFLYASASDAAAASRELYVSQCSLDSISGKTSCKYPLAYKASSGDPETTPSQEAASREVSLRANGTCVTRRPCSSGSKHAMQTAAKKREPIVPFLARSSPGGPHMVVHCCCETRRSSGDGALMACSRRYEAVDLAFILITYNSLRSPALMMLVQPPNFFPISDVGLLPVSLG